MQLKTHYSSYNVMKEQDHWDDHTREIVLKRLDVQGSLQKLTGEEVDLIRAFAALLVDDARSQLMDYVVKHFDQQFSTDIGEAERKTDVPPARQLIKDGLAAVNHLAQREHQSPFCEIAAEKQIALLVGMESDTVTLQTPQGAAVPASAFFNKMLLETVKAYYSHPQVWSEIGYGGPAYPRGYVRSEFGLTDPWEAKRDA